MELRRKNKPAPAEIKPPADPEEWIARANADGAPLQTETISDKPARRSTTPGKPAKRPTPKVKRQQPGSLEELETPKQQVQPKQSEQRKHPGQILSPTPAPSAGSRYISFAIDSITLSLFRDLSFTLDKGNTATLAHIIETCARMGKEEFQQFPESQVVIGNMKRTMSFLLLQSSLDTLHALALRLKFRNKSALCRYLIQLFSYHNVN